MGSMTANLESDGTVVPEWSMGDRLRKIRRDHLGGISQERMAELLEVPRDRYAQWERGGGNPRLSEAKRIAEILLVEAGVPVAWTLGFTSTAHPAFHGVRVEQRVA